MRPSLSRIRRPLAVLATAFLLLSFLFVSPAAAHHQLPPGIPSTSTAWSQLDQLTVEPEGASAPYERSHFPHWRVVDSPCNARQYVLRRDGHSVRTDDRCRPTSGRWFSEFDGVWTSDAAEFDVDHFVPLAEAWRSGADGWSRDRRTEFANDVHSPQLWPVTRQSNQDKGDKDPARWMPPRTAVHCDYAKAWVTVKHRYGMSVDARERGALVRTLDEHC